MFPDLVVSKDKLESWLLVPRLFIALALPGPEEDTTFSPRLSTLFAVPGPEEEEEAPCAFSKDVVEDIEGDCTGDGVDVDEDNDPCTIPFFSAGLDGSEKNKRELVSFLFKEVAVADTLKKSHPMIPIIQQERTANNAKPMRLFLQLATVKKTTLL